MLASWAFGSDSIAPPARRRIGILNKKGAAVTGHRHRSIGPICQVGGLLQTVLPIRTAEKLNCGNPIRIYFAQALDWWVRNCNCDIVYDSVRQQRPCTEAALASVAVAFDGERSHAE